MLHRVSTSYQPGTGYIDSNHLGDCLSYLHDHKYSLLSLEQLILAIRHGESPPPKSVVFTIDDGYIDQAEIAAPIFLEHECPLTFFVITGMLDHRILPWDAQIAWIIESSKKPQLENCTSIRNLDLDIFSNMTRRELRRSIQISLRAMDTDSINAVVEQLAHDADVEIPSRFPDSFLPMDWDTARELEQRGVRFAPHSVSHNILSRLARDAVASEIRESWKTLENELKQPLKIFCYPNGNTFDYGDREIELIKQEGYLGAVSTTPKFVKPDILPDDNLYRLPRLALPGNMTDFIQHCEWFARSR